MVCAPKHATALYSLTVPPPEHRQWLSCLLSNLRQCFNRAVHSARCSLKWWCQRSSLARIAYLHLLDQDRWAPIPADKGGGYILCTAPDLFKFRKQIVNSAWYSPVPNAAVEEQAYKVACHQYCKTASNIVRADLHHSLSDLTSSLQNGVRSFTCKLNGTIKAHKPAGQVAMRAIHSASSYSFSSLGRWLTSRVDKRLRLFDHIAFSPSQFLARIMDVTLEPDDELVHWDLDDFYMTGRAEHHTHHTSLLVAASERNVVTQALDILLGHQFLRTSLGDDAGTQYWQMILGAEQGLNYSSAVSSASFCHAVELCGPGLARPAFQRALRIKCYQRMADNLFFIIKSDAVPELLRVLSNIGSYSGKIESIGETCEMFDFNLFRGTRFQNSCCLDFEPVFREKGPPLSPDLSHPSSLHLAWPRAYITRLWLRSSNLAIFRRSRDIFLTRLRSHYWPPWLIEELNEVDYSRACAPEDLCTKPRRLRQPEIWQSFPYILC